MMRAETPAELLLATKWSQVPIYTWLLSILWFVRIYLGAGRMWLAWTISGLRTIYLLIGLLLVPNVIYREVDGPPHAVSWRVGHGGPTVSPSPWYVLASCRRR